MTKSPLQDSPSRSSGISFSVSMATVNRIANSSISAPSWGKSFKRFTIQVIGSRPLAHSTNTRQISAGDFDLAIVDLGWYMDFTIPEHERPSAGWQRGDHVAQQHVAVQRRDDERMGSCGALHHRPRTSLLRLDRWDIRSPHRFGAHLHPAFSPDRPGWFWR